MARIETDPNYTAPTFSRATEATDLFKKSDVQALAAAMSTHDHNATGKGLMIAPPDNSLNGVKLLNGSVDANWKLTDGSISTIKLAANAATHFLGHGGYGSGWQVPSPGAWYESDISATVTVAGAAVRVDVCGQFNFSTAGAISYVALGVDGAAPSSGMTVCQAAVAGGVTGFAAFNYFVGLPAGSHRFGLWFFLNAGTGGLWSSAPTHIFVTEFKR